jgi:electron transfer flavoprotein beta subunit
MGPPAALEVLLEALEHGVDKGVLLSDRRLAASDTLATAYALHKVILWLGKFDLIFCGLQTTDGDTAQVGPQIAERLNLPQVTYCEDFAIENDKAKARRIIEGGLQYVKSELPLLVTVANSYHQLEYKSFRGAWKVQWLQRKPDELKKYITTVDLDVVGALPDRCGLKGSPTIVAHTDKVGEIGGNCKMYEGASPKDLVDELLKAANVKEYVKA